MFCTQNSVRNTGRLKPEVKVDFSSHQACIRYALWEVSLPLEWVTHNQPVKDLLDRRITGTEASADPVAKPLALLLEAQGCFLQRKEPRYSLRTVKQLFDPLRSKWYADYYAHPAWEMIRSGRASLNGLLSWLVHNYHISRAAGTAAARMSMIAPHHPWSSFFEQDALEEYWHCHAYYSLNELKLADIGREYITTSIPLPGSLAFEDHALQVAESDWLGHALIAYFQESSIAFKSDSETFYATVERHYGVEGIFDPWKKHIQIDVDHGHADGLADLFDSATEVSNNELETGLLNAWLAYYFLKSSLNKIVRECQHYDGLNLRLAADMPTARHLQLDKLSAANRDYLLCGLRASSIRALGFSREHRDVIACGRIAQTIDAPDFKENSPRPTNPWCQAIVNFMQESAKCPGTWLTLMNQLAKALPALNNIYTQSEDIDHRNPASLQLDELVTNCVNCTDTIPLNILNQLIEDF